MSGDWDVFIVDVYGYTYPIGVTQDADNHVTITAAYYNGAAWVNMGSGFASTGDTGSAYNRHHAHVNTWVDLSGVTVIQYSAYSTITGAPGRLIQGANFTYRLAARP